jgi:hypothetical protein
MNTHLTTLQKFYNFKHPLTFHQGRHSWATTICLSNGVPIETVSRTMGHRSIKTTQIYAEVTNMKMDEDMKLLETRIGEKYRFPATENRTDEFVEFEKNNNELTKLKLEEAV